jgi:hypothetical protein
MKKFKMLSLDGGGAWALIQVMTLKNIFGANTNGWEVLDNFDFAVANSGGTITLAGLLKGMDLKTVEAMFKDEDRRKSIFVTQSIFDRWTNSAFGIGAKYETPKKLAGLEKSFAVAEGKIGKGFADMSVPEVGKRINEARKEKGLGPLEFMMIGFDYDNERAKFFRSNARSKSGGQKAAPSARVVDAVHASTNAPVNYFDRPAVVKSGSDYRNYWDGAVGGYNNPLLAGITEVLANTPADPAKRQERRQSIVALSIGTGSTRIPVVKAGTKNVRPYEKERAEVGGIDILHLGSDIKKLATSILADPPDAATFISHVVLDEPMPVKRGETVSDTRIVRMNPVAQPRFTKKGWQPWPWFKDRSSDGEHSLFERIVGIDMDAVSEDDVKDIIAFTRKWLADGVPNQAIRTNRTFDTEIGQSLFKEAKAQWRKVSKA